jgi:hypothetical protein
VSRIELTRDVEVSGAEIVAALENLHWPLKVVDNLDSPSLPMLQPTHIRRQQEARRNDSHPLSHRKSPLTQPRGLGRRYGHQDHTETTRGQHFGSLPVALREGASLPPPAREGESL